MMRSVLFKFVAVVTLVSFGVATMSVPVMAAIDPVEQSGGNMRNGDFRVGIPTPSSTDNTAAPRVVPRPSQSSPSSSSVINSTPFVPPTPQIGALGQGGDNPLKKIFDQLGGAGSVTNILANALASFLQAQGGKGSGVLAGVASLIGQALGGNSTGLPDLGTNQFAGAANSFNAASLSNSVMSALNGGGLPSSVASLADYIRQPVDPAQLSGQDMDEMYCWAKVVCSEARGESFKGKVAVAHAVNNRKKSPKFPNSICGVIKQKSQFEKIFQYKPNTNSNTWRECQEAAAQVATGASSDFTNGADHFLALNVLSGRGDPVPSWARKMTVVGREGGHTFYRSS